MGIVRLRRYLEPSITYGVEGLWCTIQTWDAFIPWHWSSGDALGHGHAKLGHDVDDLAARRGFGLLC